MPPKPERRPVLDRRQALKILGIGGSVMAGALLGLGTERLVRNETPHEYPIDESVLWQAIKNRPFPRWFGMYPDFEREDDPWQEVVMAGKKIAPISTVGHFAILETFTDKNQTDALLDQMEQTREQGAVPVLSLGPNSSEYKPGFHTFHQKNIPILKRLVGQATKQLDRYKDELVVRIFYEMNMPQWNFGPKSDFFGRQHEDAYIKAFVTAATELSKRQHKTLMAFSPSAEFPVSAYYPRRGRQPLPDITGLDGYDLYPGERQFFNQNYWLYGWRSPEALFLPGLNDLVRLGRGRVPVVYWELGSLQRDPQWLRHAVLLLFALGGAGFMHFNYDKSHQEKPWEANWRMNAEILKAYGTIFRKTALR